MIHIKSLIPKFLQKQGIKKQVEAIEVCKIADKILKAAFGEPRLGWEAFGLPAGEAGSNTAKALFFRNSTLYVKCSNSTLANEIYLRKERIKNEINEEMGQEIIKDILIKTG